MMYILLAGAFSKAALIAMIQINSRLPQTLLIAADDYSVHKVTDLSLKTRNKVINGYG